MATPFSDPASPRAALVMLAAGEGRRTGHHTNKVLLPLAGRRVFTWSLGWARRLPTVTRTLLVIREQDREQVLATVDREVEPPDVTVVTGGDSRHGSEWEALQSLAPAIESGEVDVVVIHDAARPLAGTALFAAVIAAAAEHGGAIPVRDQGHLTSLDGAESAPDRVVAVQTPQAFAARPLLAAYRQAAADGFVGTDTASCMERYTDVPVRCVPGDAGNIKITFPEDLFLAERLLAKASWDLSGGLERATAPARGRRHLGDLWHSGELA
ncbi:2-C-methyl-D-erythritol 4-phosphate cytidylyltransferase [Nocardioides sp. cx-169]|uniref:IspD/TarI family cytidylyltransferase n=1 Tax=Nocardioides sp. cx-169 TaxID=2899080 RepID=UPI001E46BB0A|nr:2-C-methyl-D-erythritol 4-phosphate cytidylyltransferase [Nocardioides sp. cx-169]MCD4533811.1 2-C-methyl-D-erythritol 4-phosphate cytidylyltransferase [Nocardioides sp. cx-169]